MVWKVGVGDAHTLLASLLLEGSGIEPLPRMERRADGKPFFPDFPGLHFNLSHSRAGRTEALALCVLSDKPVGCDIEVVKPRSARLPRYALDEREYEWFHNRGETWADFCTLWTLKEARVKCTGLGLRVHPREIKAPLLEPGEEADFEGFHFTTLAGDGWRGAIAEQTTSHRG